MEAEIEIKITKRKLKSLSGNTVKSAEAINLIYVADTDKGITRIKEKGEFVYLYDSKKVEDEETLMRIKHLVIPPAWQQVWICPSANGHLQVTGLDAMNRKQYKYHSLWNTLRNHTKFYHLFEFGKVLPAIRERINKDLAQQSLSQEKVLAAIVSLMQETNIRIGNTMYEKLYGSFGLTTLKDRHVKIDGNNLRFSFKGKKGVYHDVSLRNKKLAKIVKQCRDIPGKELFQYYDDNGERRCIDSGMVNNYIKEISGGHFTAKDFRTWAGSLHALEAFNSLGCCDTITETKKKIVEALDIVAKLLGNTRAVCKKYYVHPAIIDHYSNNTLFKYLKLLETNQEEHKWAGLSAEEEILMKILEDAGSIVIAA